MMSKTKWLSIVLTLCLIVSSIVVVSLKPLNRLRRYHNYEKIKLKIYER